MTVGGVVIQNNAAKGASTDGIDSSSYVLVQNSDIDCNDHNFCLKAGHDWDGLRVNRPTRKAKMSSCDPGNCLKTERLPMRAFL